MATRKIFLASSNELLEDREKFEIFINRKNNDWNSKGVFLELVIWEDFLDAMPPTRLQDKYNEAIRGCDIFVMLFCTKVGKYTAEEFETAFKQFQDTKKPFIYTYFKKAPVDIDGITHDDIKSLKEFQQKIKDLGHFQTNCKNIEELTLHFYQQLDKLVANGFIKFESVQRTASVSYQAELKGSGAITQGNGAVAVGAGGVYVGGKNTGSINNGTQINRK